MAEKRRVKIRSEHVAQAMDPNVRRIRHVSEGLSEGLSLFSSNLNSVGSGSLRRFSTLSSLGSVRRLSIAEDDDNSSSTTTNNDNHPNDIQQHDDSHDDTTTLNHSHDNDDDDEEKSIPKQTKIQEQLEDFHLDSTNNDDTTTNYDDVLYGDSERSNRKLVVEGDMESLRSSGGTTNNNNDSPRASSSKKEEGKAAVVRNSIQYNLTKRPKKGLFAYLTRGDSFDGGGGAPSSNGDGCGGCCRRRMYARFATDRIATRYIHWAFRSPFLLVFLNAAVIFFGVTFFFAIAYWFEGRHHPECIDGVDYSTLKLLDALSDAFALSWTTFSTVGYGVIFPAVSSSHHCAGVTILATLESFVGILFGSFLGAIMIAKVGRIQSNAQIIFSDPILVRFGSGVKVEECDDSSSEDDENNGDAAHHPGSSLFWNSSPADYCVYDTSIPCPILEFRIVNRLSSLNGGEIIDATISIVASVDILQLGSDLLLDDREKRRKGKKGKKGAARRNRVRLRKSDHTGEDGGGGGGDGGDDDGFVNDRFLAKRKNRLESVQELINEKRAAETENSFTGGSSDAFSSSSCLVDNSGKLVPTRRFTKLQVESPDHPFFKRVWNVRHVIDEMSPLLKPQVRKMIRDNDGFWPPELNSHEGVRASIAFDQILVSFSGTSNADANSVYAQHVYHYVNMNVGYRFVNCLYRDARKDGSLCVDASLINDVTGQAGGGAEPFMQNTEQYVHDMLVL